MRLISRVRKKFRQSTSQISTYKIEELYIEARSFMLLGRGTKGALYQQITKSRRVAV